MLTVYNNSNLISGHAAADNTQRHAFYPEWVGRGVGTLWQLMRLYNVLFTICVISPIRRKIRTKPSYTLPDPGIEPETLCPVDALATTPPTRQSVMYPKQPKRFILFSKCCFCVPLETGCFILGYFSLILNFVISVYFVGTLFYMAFYNYDLEYLHNKVLKDGGTVTDYLDGSKIMTTVVVTILDGGLNVIWFAMSIVLLIGLHRKRPGHIKFHVSVACIRLLLSIICAFFHGPYMAHSTLVCTVEIVFIFILHKFNHIIFTFAVFSAYFILLYYSYAIMLERDQRPKNPKPVMEIIASVISKPPQHIDKVTLTEGEGNYCTV
ncbi:hypothetical protein SFRURICE_013338 [Spodoptera frugiperda]|nr:hypothetical protein SFRURICE_013338 [Spodoptera frugiperda]